MFMFSNWLSERKAINFQILDMLLHNFWQVTDSLKA